MSSSSVTSPIEGWFDRSAGKARRKWLAMLKLLGDPRLWPRDEPSPGWIRDRPSWHADTTETWAAAGATSRVRALADAEFTEAKYHYLVVTYLYVLAGALAVVAFVFTPEGWEQYALGLAVIAVQLLAWSVRLKGSSEHAIAQELDWRALLLDAMGDGETRVRCEAIELETRVSSSAVQRTRVQRGYYSSDARLGIRRLQDNLQETAFFTACLYRAAADRAVLFARLALAPAVVTGVAALALTDEKISKLLLILVSGLLPTWDVLVRIRSWRAASLALMRVVGKLDDLSYERSLPLLSDMVVATAVNPPIPERVYDRNRAAVQALAEARRCAAMTSIGTMPTGTATPEQLELYARAQEARDRAYAPYSGFKVGAALKADDGTVVTAANVENSSYPATLCAETAAVGALFAAGHQRIAAVAVAAEGDSSAPCGKCRQIISEHANHDVAVVYQLDGQVVVRTMRELLPDAFELSSS